MNGKERFLAACSGVKLDRPPVWVMRQAGRYLPEYRELRERHSFLDVCRSPELAREVALQPLRRFPLDAAILFSDILVVPEAMGQKVSYLENGPVLHPRVDSADAVELLADVDVGKTLGYVGDAIEAIREGIGPDKALIGFSGGPYTLATYMVEGGGAKRFINIRRMMLESPALLDKLLGRLASLVARYLRMQAERGADALHIFDTWAGELAPDSYRRFVLPGIQRIISDLSDVDAPVIYFINGVGGLLEEMAKTGAKVLGIDWRTSMTDARRRSEDAMALQGNLDPLELLGPEERIRRRVREIHAEMEGGPGHIFSLGHGLFPEAPIAGLSTFIDEVTRLGD